MVEMKKVWSRPLTVVQNFEANEYVAACGDTEYGVYKFECNAPEGTLYYYNRWGGTTRLGDYNPCGDKHEASKSSEFPDGFIDYNGNGREEYDTEHVIVWIETNRWGSFKDAHATTNLNRDSWETSKS